MLTKKILNVCPTGTQSTKENSLAPIYENEIIDEVIRLYEVGITTAHIHARDNEGKNTYKKEVFQNILEGIKKYATELVICVSLSGRYFKDFSLRTEVLSLKPDMASLTMSSLNFPQTASINDPETILKLIDEMAKFDVKPEIECFDSGMLRYTSFLQKRGILKDPLYINVILGNLFNASAALESVAHIKNNFPKNSVVCFGGIGKYQLKSNLYGLLEADGVRIGLEDNFYYSDKTKATNHELILRIKEMGNILGYEFMTSDEFRKIAITNG